MMRNNVVSVKGRRLSKAQKFLVASKEGEKKKKRSEERMGTGGRGGAGINSPRKDKKSKPNAKNAHRKLTSVGCI